MSSLPTSQCLRTEWNDGTINVLSLFKCSHFKTKDVVPRSNHWEKVLSYRKGVLHNFEFFQFSSTFIIVKLLYLTCAMSQDLQCWLYTVDSRGIYSLVSGYPKQISAVFNRVSTKIDSAFVWSKNGKTYFTRGLSVCFIYSNYIWTLFCLF